MIVLRSWQLAPLLAAILIASPAIAEDSALALADLEAYRDALGTRPGGPSPTVSFRDLWERPAGHAGRAVAVEGRVARLFRQPPMGEFPALTEAWILSPADDPFCLVFPSGAGRASPPVGASVRFRGTYLRRIRYRAGDVPRLAPLIVGPDAPTPSGPGARPVGPSWSTIDWMVGMAAASAIAMVLLRRHLARPPSLSSPVGPPPTFLDGDPTHGPDGVARDEHR